MTDVARRRISGLKITGIIAGILLLIAFATYLWMRSVADRKWAWMEKKVRDLTAEVRAREPVRPVLRGQAVPGSAWDDYDLALKEAAKFKVSGSVLVDYVSRRPTADRAKVEVLVAAHAAALDRFRAGTRRSSGIRPHAWEEGAFAKMPEFLAYSGLVNLSACQARFLAEGGRVDEALDLLLDAAQFARDAGSNTLLIDEMIGIGLLGTVFDELRALIHSGKLTPEQLGRIEQELRILDGSFMRHGEILINEALWMGCSMIRDGGGNNFLGRLMTSGGFETLLHAMERVAACDSMSWAEAQKLTAEVSKDLEKSKNPVVAIAGPSILNNQRLMRQKRAQLRLLRAAAAYRATGKMPDLDDPFGTKLQSSATGTKLKVWSVGADGVDDGGAGEWEISKGKDIVLEVDR